MMVQFYSKLLCCYTQTLRVCFLHSTARMETDCNLKKLAQLFEVKLLC